MTTYADDVSGIFFTSSRRIVIRGWDSILLVTYSANLPRSTASALPAGQALRMATLNGARALGLDEETGSLLPGKAADITAVNVGGIETQPLYHVISQLVYASGRHQVSDVWVAGRHVVKEGVLTTLDEHDILSKAQVWQGKIKKFD